MDEPILHQPSHCTHSNRHPDVFAKAATLSPKKILSFGCSTGEECMTLRKYIPGAHIVGAEINETIVKENQRRNEDPNITYIHSKDLKEHGPYDMIFAINVLVRDVPNPLDYPLYVFDYFERQILQFDTLLKIKGHLVLVHTQHDFSLTDISKNYTTHSQFHQKMK